MKRHTLRKEGNQSADERVGAGEEALRVADGGRKASIVVTDMVMPLMGGRELLKKLRAVYPDLPIIFMSGYIDTISDHELVADREAVFLQKPFTPKVLSRAVRKSLMLH